MFLGYKSLNNLSGGKVSLWNTLSLDDLWQQWKFNSCFWRLLLSTIIRLCCPTHKHMFQNKSNWCVVVFKQRSKSCSVCDGGYPWTGRRWVPGLEKGSNELVPCGRDLETLYFLHLVACYEQEWGPFNLTFMLINNKDVPVGLWLRSLKEVSLFHSTSTGPERNFWWSFFGGWKFKLKPHVTCSS